MAWLNQEGGITYGLVIGEAEESCCARQKEQNLPDPVNYECVQCISMLLYIAGGYMGCSVARPHFDFQFENATVVVVAES